MQKQGKQPRQLLTIFQMAIPISGQKLLGDILFAGQIISGEKKNESDFTKK